MNSDAIVTSALRKLLVTQPGGTPSSAHLTVGREALNDLVKLWSADSSLIYQDTREEIVIASGTNSFTLGATGDYVTGKPVKLLNASIKENNQEYPLKIADKNIYEGISDIDSTSKPEWIYFRNTHPDSTFYFESTTDVAYTLILTSMKELSTFPDGTTEISLPDYYEAAFKHNLVISLAAEMGAANRVTPLMMKLAEDSEGKVIGKSVKMNVSKTELAFNNNYERNSDL